MDKNVSRLSSLASHTWRQYSVYDVRELNHLRINETPKKMHACARITHGNLLHFLLRLSALTL